MVVAPDRGQGSILHPRATSFRCCGWGKENKSSPSPLPARSLSAVLPLRSSYPNCLLPLSTSSTLILGFVQQLREPLAPGQSRCPHFHGVPESRIQCSEVQRSSISKLTRFLFPQKFRPAHYVDYVVDSFPFCSTRTSNTPSSHNFSATQTCPCNASIHRNNWHSCRD